MNICIIRHDWSIFRANSGNKPEIFKSNLKYSGLIVSNATGLRSGIEIWYPSRFCPQLTLFFKFPFQDGTGGFTHQDLVVTLHQVIGQDPDLLVTAFQVEIMGERVERGANRLPLIRRGARVSSAAAARARARHA